jgi:type II secretory pathway predicted ATPase ExeA
MLAELAEDVKAGKVKIYAWENFEKEKAIEEIYRRSKGTPRTINILCDNSLLNWVRLGSEDGGQ